MTLRGVEAKAMKSGTKDGVPGFPALLTADEVNRVLDTSGLLPSAGGTERNLVPSAPVPWAAFPSSVLSGA